MDRSKFDRKPHPVVDNAVAVLVRKDGGEAKRAPVKQTRIPGIYLTPFGDRRYGGCLKARV